MRTTIDITDHTRPQPPRPSRTFIAGPAPISRRAPTRHQSLRARFNDADRKQRTQLAGMNQAAPDFWKGSR